jgi:protein-S-isoprenylcysteine O-methyltransferase Ste14
MLVNLVGRSLAFRSSVGLLLTVLTIPPLVARIYREEKLLRSQLGSEYNVYRARTWRLIPWLY